MRRSGWLACLLLLLFWAVSIGNLDRFPPIHNDETAVIASGYKLFTQGVYGLDMYWGHQGRERVYLEIMPLLPWLQGLSSWLIGVGVWQMRLLPVVCGLLTLALSFALGRRLGQTAVGLLAMGLLLFWQWSPLHTDPFHASGIPLVDVSRIARYDILLAPLSVGVLYAWVQAQRTGQNRFYGLAGIGTGLAGLSNLYGLFWLPTLLLLAGWENNLREVPPSAETSDQTSRRVGFIHIASFVLGLTAVFSPWLALIAHYSAEFTAQFAMHSQRFALSDPSFYLTNLRLEGQRYFLGLDRGLEDPTRFARLGLGLVLLLPCVYGWLGYRALYWRQRPASWLLGPCMVLPLLLALLIQKKSFGYLLLVIPLWAVALAWGAVALWQTMRLWRVTRLSRLLLAVVAAVILLEGALAMGRMQATAVASPSPTQFFAELQTLLPANGRIIGPQTYWPGLYQRDYRSFILGFALARPQNSFAVALETIAADIILVDTTSLEWLAAYDHSQSPPGPYTAQFWHYMAQHQAQQIGELTSFEGQVVQIYRLTR